MVRTFRTGCNARPVEKANMAFSIAGIRSSHRSTFCTSGSSRCMTGMGASLLWAATIIGSNRMHPEREGVVKSLRKEAEKTPKQVGPVETAPAWIMVIPASRQVEVLLQASHDLVGAG